MPAKKPIDMVDRLRGELYRTGHRGMVNKAKEWLLDKAQKLVSFSAKNRADMLSVIGRHRPRPEMGGMCFFVYDAKHKDTLPYFDRFPLVVPIEFYADGFLGLNLHYLPPRERLLFLNQLRKFRSDPHMTRDTKLRVTYGHVKNGSRVFSGRGYRCIHRYLYGHVRSPFLNIDSDEWDISVALPAENWYYNTKVKG